MLSRPLSFLLFFLAGSIMAPAQNSTYLDYIENYRAIAISEMERTGVPASIKMAQAILESNAGQSDLARKANNHFGIKCSSKWNGGTFRKVDDDRDRRGRLIKSCFRRYGSALESFIAHSDFLRFANKRYAFLFDLDVTDYKGWARGLKKAGYATSPSYHRKLIDIIERYELFRLDEMKSEELLAQDEAPERDSPEPESPLSPAAPAPKKAQRLITEIAYHNDVKNIVANRDETVASLAEAADIDPDRLIGYNENLRSRKQLVRAGTRVYMQPKRKNFRGRSSWHKVQEGESMMDISIAYGIRLDKLYARNRLKPGREPVKGAGIKLRGRKVNKPPRSFNPATEEAKDRPPAIVMEDEEPMLDMEVTGSGLSEKPERTLNRPELNREDPDGSLQPDSRDEPGEEEIQPETEDPPLLPPITPNLPAADRQEPSLSTEPAPREDGSDDAAPVNIHEDPFGKPAGTVVSPTYYTVQPGDTLWSISRRYETTVERVKQLNRLNDNYIRKGMKLRVK